jgi:rod shape-determining protein MreD
VHKITRPRIYLILGAAVFVHLTALVRIRIFNSAPDLVLMCVIFFGIFLGPRMGLEAGLVGGLLTDIFSFGAFGMNALISGITGFLAGAFSAKVFKESSMIQFLAVFLFESVSMALHFAAAASAAGLLHIPFHVYLANSVLPSAVYTAAVSLVAFPVLIRAFGLEREEEFL